MSILITCECGKLYQVGQENVGRRFACNECGREMAVTRGEVRPYDAPTAAPHGPEDWPDPATSGKAIASLILGFLALGCLFFAGMPAIALGVMALSDMSHGRGRLRGKGMAIAGIALGAFGTFLMPVAWLVLTIPLVQATLENQRRGECALNLTRIGVAFQKVYDAKEQYPPAAIVDDRGRPLLSWRVAILPNLGEEGLYRRFKLDEPWDSPSNRALLDQMPAVYACPVNAPGHPGMTRYRAIVGPGTMFEGNKGTTLREVTDGTVQTLLVAEGRDPVEWTKPDEIDADAIASALGSGHRLGSNALFVNRSVRLIKSTTPPAVLRALTTKNGGEVVTSDPF